MSKAVRACFLASAWLLGSALLGTGCSFSHLYGGPVRGVELESRQRLYVERHARDQRNIAALIAARLRTSGFEATSGPPGGAPPGVQAIVSYEDHWYWDMANYLLVLRIDFRDPATNELLASGQSYRPSMARKEPEFMVDEIVGAILGGG